MCAFTPESFNSTAMPNAIEGLLDVKLGDIGRFVPSTANSTDPLHDEGTVRRAAAFDETRLEGPPTETAGERGHPAHAIQLADSAETCDRPELVEGKRVGAFFNQKRLGFEPHFRSGAGVHAAIDVLGQSPNSIRREAVW